MVAPPSTTSSSSLRRFRSSFLLSTSRVKLFSSYSSISFSLRARAEVCGSEAEREVRPVEEVL